MTATLEQAAGELHDAALAVLRSGDLALLCSDAARVLRAKAEALGRLLAECADHGWFDFDPILGGGCPECQAEQDDRERHAEPDPDRAHDEWRAGERSRPW